MGPVPNKDKKKNCILFKSGQIFRKDAHCSENYFKSYFRFFWLSVFEIWSILYMVVHTQNRPYLKNWKAHKKKTEELKNNFPSNADLSWKFGHFWTKKLFSLEEIFANMWLTLTSEARVLNPKACGVQCRSPGRECDFLVQNQPYLKN